jgi:hypothetical protein
MINPAQQLQQLSMLRGTQPPMPQSAQPIQDPRMQALQQYMQMKGAQPGPNLPQQMPNGQDGVRPMTLPENQQAVEGMDLGQIEAYPNDTNAYFRELDPEQDEDNPDQERDADDRIMDELNTAETRRPSYVDNKGNPSPNEQYTDEDMLQGVSDKIDGAQFSGDPESDKKMLMDDPSETNIEAFIKIHGEENLPDDLQEPDVSDPAGNR